MEINKYVGSKIKEYRQNKGITQQELAEYLNTTSQTVSRYEGGILETNNNILFKLAEYFNISIDDFFPSFDNALIEENYRSIQIPLFGTIKAGIPIESQTDIIGYLDIPINSVRGNKKFFALKISGDSMSPKYQENDIVIFEQSEDIEEYNNKDVAVMINGSESTFKKILINEKGIVLIPYNSNYDMMMFSKEEVELLPIIVIGIAREKRTRIDWGVLSWVLLKVYLQL